MFDYRPGLGFSLVMLVEVPLEARSQSRRLQFFSVDLVCILTDQICAALMRGALFMDD